MADEAQDVGGIGVGLNLELAGWSANVSKAKAELRGLIEMASNVTVMTPRLSSGRGRGTLQGEAAALAPKVTPQFSVTRDSVRDMRSRMNAMLREHSLQGQAVSVPIKVGRTNYGAIRAEISAGIGEVPVRIKVITADAKSDLSAVMAAATGGSTNTANVTIGKARARAGIQRRAMGGPVEPNGRYLVGEAGPEVLQMRGSGGMVYPHREEGTPRHSGSEHLSGQQLNYLGNLRAIAKRMSPAIVKAGRDWYPMAGSFGRRIADETGVKHEQAIGVLTALSAGTAWNSNMTKYGTAMRTMATPGMFHETAFPYGEGLDAHRKAIAIMHGVDPKKAFGTSPKVGQFYGGVMGDLDTLTLDRWAFRTTTRNGTDQLNGRERTRAEKAWRKVAEEHGLKPAEFQAALWLQQQIETPAKLGSSKAVKPAPGQEGLGFAGGGFVHASEASALRRLREITHKSGTIMPGYEAEAQRINLLVEQMRTQAKTPFVSPWARRMMAGEGAPKEFGGNSGDWEHRRRGGWSGGWQNQPRDLKGRFGSRADEGTWFEDEMRRYLPGKPGGYGTKEEFGSGLDLMAREHWKERQSYRPMRSEDEGHWLFGQHRWSGGRAAAYAATLENEGGTFGAGGRQPSRGYAVASETGTFAQMAATDKLAFIKAYRAVRKTGAPFVGTWLHDGMIDVDPAEVAGTKRGADLLARKRAQEAYFDLGKFQTQYVKPRRRDPSTGQFSMWPWASLHHRALGGLAFVGGALLREGKIAHIGEESPGVSEEINRIRGGERERSLGIGRWGAEGDWRVLHKNTGDATSVEQSAQQGQIDVHNHPSGRSGIFMERPSNADVFTTLAGGLREGWAVTPGMESVVRPDPDIHRGYDRPYLLTRGDRAKFFERYFKVASKVGLTSLTKMNDPRYYQQQTGRFDELMDKLGRQEGFEYIRRERSTPGEVGNPDLEERIQRMAEQEAIKAAKAIERARQAAQRGAKTADQMTMFARGGHGDAGGRPYIVGEIGPELFVPDRLKHQIPHDVFQQLPKRRDGGVTEIGRGGQQVWQAPEDGWIIPNRLMNKVPRRAGGTPGDPRDLGPQNLGNLSSSELRALGIDPAHLFNLSATDQRKIEAAMAAKSAPPPPPAAVRRPPPPPISLVGAPGPAVSLSGAMAGREREAARVAAEREDMARSTAAVAARRAAAAAAPPPRPAAPTASRDVSARMAAVDEVLASKTRPVRRAPSADTFAESMRRELRGEGQLIPARSPKMAAGAIAAQFFGRRSFQQRQFDAEVALRDATRATRQYQTAVSNQRAAIYDFTKLQKTVTAAYASGAPAGAYDAEMRERREFLDTRKQQTQLARAEVEGARGRATTAAKAAEPTPAGIAKNITAFAGGQFAFQLAFKGLAVAEDAILPPLRKIWDQFAGFEPTLTRVSNALGQDTSALSGNAKMAVANAAANAGLSGSSYSLLKANLELAGGVKAGTTSLEQAGDLYKANTAIQQGGAPQGLYGGYGGLLGSPFLAQQLGGGKGYAETLSGNLGATLGGGGGDIAKNVPSGIEYLTNETFRNYVSGQDKQQQKDQGITGGSALSVVTDVLGNIGDTIGGRSWNREPAPGAGFQTAQQRFTPVQINSATAQMNDFNESLKRGSMALGTTSKDTLNWAATQQEVDAATRTAIQSGNIYGVELAQQGIVLRKASGAIEDNAKAATQAYEAASRGQSIPSSAVFMAQQGQALAAQAQGAALSGQRERNLAIPGQLGIQLAANPFLPASTGLPAGYKSSLNTGTQQLQNQLTAEGQSAIKGLTDDISKQLGPAAAQQFTGYTNTISNYGAQIAKLNVVLANRQAAQSAVEYGNSLRIINRSISDAQGLVSGAGATSGPNANLGAVQRQQFQLSQQSNILSTQLAQKQVNFQTASAGFLVQGATPEERAARQKEAEIEASYAQRQLNIQKAQIPLAQTSFDVGATRNLTDLTAQRTIIEEQRRLDLTSIDISKRIAADNVKIEQATAKASSLVNQSTGVFSQALGVAVSGAAQGIGSFTDLLVVAEKKIADAYGITLGPTATTTTTTGTGRPPNLVPTRPGPRKPHASGWLGDVRSSTDMTVGEAGHETVAILRNPRRATIGSPSGGGGGTNVQIMITGNTVRDDRDIDTIARRVEEIVVRNLGRRASIQGLRSP